MVRGYLHTKNNLIIEGILNFEEEISHGKIQYHSYPCKAAATLKCVYYCVCKARFRQNF